MLNLDLLGRRKVPFVDASEQNECGLACLAAISEYHRGQLTLSDIRQLASHSGRGETLLEIRNLANAIGLSARGVRIEVKDLGKLTLPAILHWDMYHFVVLERVSDRGVIIMDPAGGRMPLPWSDVEKAFTGIALEVEPSDRWQVATKPLRKASVLALVRPFSRWRADLVAIAALSVLLELLVLVMPMQMRVSVDTALQSSDARLAWILGAGFLLVALVLGAISVVRTWVLVVFGTRVAFELRNRFVRALHEKPPAFFLKHHTGDILSRAHSVDSIQALVTTRLLQAFLDALMSIAIVVVLLVTSPLLGGAVVLLGLINVGTTALLHETAVQNSRRHLRAVAKADSIFLENARAGTAIRLFGKETVRSSVWRSRFVDVTNLALANERLTMFATHVALVTGMMSSVVLIAMGTALVIGGSLTLGTMMMLAVFQTILVARLADCAAYLVELRRVQTHAERVDEVLYEPPAVSAPPARQHFVVPDGEPVRIEVRNVWFRYGHDAPWILKGVNLSIEPGESVAIAGTSGSGKTTLMGIMLGLLQPSEGEVLVNGRDLRTIASTDFARIIGVVAQDGILFHGTVADNIAFFEAPVDMVRVQEVAQQANIATDIEKMPMQYRSILAEAAADISGGQRQRIFIARALYHRPRILFLDEATSHLDSPSERLVSDTVRKLQMTRVLIAHRRETIATADRVLVLDPDTGQLQAGSAP
jgi:ATP-binding cassette subfamily B protein RaxB